MPFTMTRQNAVLLRQLEYTVKVQRDNEALVTQRLKKLEEMINNLEIQKNKETQSKQNKFNQKVVKILKFNTESIQKINENRNKI